MGSAESMEHIDLRQLVYDLAAGVTDLERLAAAPDRRAHPESDLLRRTVTLVGVLSLAKGGVSLDGPTLVADLDHRGAGADTDLAADQLPRHRGEGAADLDEDVRTDRGRRRLPRPVPTGPVHRGPPPRPYNPRPRRGTAGRRPAYRPMTACRPRPVLPRHLPDNTRQSRGPGCSGSPSATTARGTEASASVVSFVRRSPAVRPWPVRIAARASRRRRSWRCRGRSGSCSPRATDRPARGALPVPARHR